MSATYEGFCEYYEKFLKAIEEMYRIASTDAYKGIGSPDPVEFNKYFAQAVEFGRIFHESLFRLPGTVRARQGANNAERHGQFQSENFLAEMIYGSEG